MIGSFVHLQPGGPEGILLGLALVGCVIGLVVWLIRDES